MFVVSVSSRKVRGLALCLAAVVCICGVVGIIFYNCGSSAEDNTTLSVNNSASDIKEIMNFISLFGWTVSPEPDEVREIIIPVEFDDVYSNYNNLQLSQGYDLTPYSGERVKSWRFTVTNYPGYEGKEFIKINILICDGKVIGGDVCSVELNGFMHGFKKDQ
ncbi:MAG: DUF4830 domain-containing protein [Clostridia bacterium]|nr:DUF4830 domain-containing protein [Clostridia bacterium]